MWLLLGNLLSVPTSAELFPGFLFSAQIRQPWDGESRYCRWRQLETDSQTETQRESKERLPVGKSLGLSVDSTTKAASHFVLICWAIMIKKNKMKRATTERVFGRAGNAEHLLSGVLVLGWAWMDTSTPSFCPIETPAVSQMGSVIWVPFGA